MLQGRRFVISGVNRLVVRVARALTAQRADVTILRRPQEDESALRLLPAAAKVIDATTQEDVAALIGADLAGANCLLALSDDDLDNLRIAVAAREATPNAPVVLRAFDPGLADQLEQGLNIRRAYSVSALAAPAFIAAACGDEVVETLRLGDGEVPICRLTVRAGSPLIGRATAEVKPRFGCGVLARRSDGTDWRPIHDGAGNVADPVDPAPLSEGDQILIGGPLFEVLRLTLRNAAWLGEGHRLRARRRKRARVADTTRPTPRHWTLLPYIAWALFAILLVSIFVFAHALHLRPIDAIYFVITTATTTGYGDISLRESPDWLKLFGCIVMLSGGALLGILFSYLSALATAERLDAVMGRRASRMTGHVVVAGLGNLGYRVARLLTDLGMRVVVLELQPGARFAEAIRPVAPVLFGDARLTENLLRAAVDQAVGFIGCSNDDLVNIQACLHVRRLSANARTVARVVDDALADRLSEAFAIDCALSAGRCAVSAFVGAATDERALRPLTVGSLALTAVRYTVPAGLSETVVADWREHGVRILALRAAEDRAVRAVSVALPLSPGDEIILCGPSDAIRAIVTP